MWFCHITQPIPGYYTSTSAISHRQHYGANAQIQACEVCCSGVQRQLVLWYQVHHSTQSLCWSFSLEASLESPAVMWANHWYYMQFNTQSACRKKSFNNMKHTHTDNICLKYGRQSNSYLPLDEFPPFLISCSASNISRATDREVMLKSTFSQEHINIIMSVEQHLSFAGNR